MGADQTSSEIDAALRAARSWLQRRAAKERATVYGWDQEVPGPAADSIYATLQRAMVDDMAADLIQGLVDQREGRRGEPPEGLRPDERPLLKYRAPNGKLTALPSDEQMILAEKMVVVLNEATGKPVYGVIVSNRHETWPDPPISWLDATPPTADPAATPDCNKDDGKRKTPGPPPARTARKHDPRPGPAR